MINALSIALALATAGTPAGDVTQDVAATNADYLGATDLAAGREEAAIARLEMSEKDAAQLINLGIAYAHNGQTRKAREMFEAALTEAQPIELKTAEEGWVDSRRLARLAMAKLDRGELTPIPANYASLDD